jgi:hypothetical protein
VNYCYAIDTLSMASGLLTMEEPLSPMEESLNWDSLTLSAALARLATKGSLGYGTNMDQQTVVWVANRDNPVLNGSTGTFGIAEDGNLKVWDTTGNVYWSTGVENSSSTNRTVKLMDSGNLVLRDDDDQLATSLWESFQNPTDTFLPGMKMDEN